MISSLYRIKREVLYGELAGMFERLRGIRYAVIKGEALSNQIYGVHDKRVSNDLDLLVSRSDVRLIEEQLNSHGFSSKQSNMGSNRQDRIMCMSYSHQIPSFYKEKYGFRLNVDINYDVFWGEYDGPRFSIADFLSDTVETNIYGVTVKTLSLEKAFVQLVLHHYKEMNSLFILSQRNSIQAKMFSDIVGLLLNNSEVLTCGCVMDLCEQYPIGEYVYYMLYYCDVVFHDKRLVNYIERLESYRNDSIMDHFGLSKNERRLWNVPFNLRLDNKNLPQIVRSQLLESDFEKISMNKKIF